MNRAELVFPVLLFAMVAALLAAGFLILDYPWSVIAFPLGAGVTVCALCAVEVTRALTVRGATARVAAADDRPPLSISSLVWMFALAPFLYGLGFVFGPAAYLLACLRTNGFSWRLSGSVAVVALLVTWGIFIKLMGVQLPIEPLWRN